MIVLCPSKEILEQNTEKLKRYGFDNVKVFSASAGTKEVGKYTMATIGSVYKCPELFEHVRFALIDECLTGDTEVLTENGWVRFNEYNGTDKVAQWDNGRVAFVTPTRFIHRRHTGVAYKVKLRGSSSGNDCIATMTPGHRQPLYYKTSNKVITKTIENTNFNDKNCMFVSAKGSGNNTPLTAIERLKIMTQADACLLHHGKDYEYFQVAFSKERKIKRFLELCARAGIKANEQSTQTPSSKNVKPRRRWGYKMPLGTDKMLSNQFDVDMGYDRAREFIKEVMQWDGYINKYGQYYYSSIIKDNVDFVAAIAFQAGYSTRQTVEQDNRSTAYHDVYRLFLLDKELTPCGGKTKEKIEIDEDVYCVTVPSSFFVVRTNGYAYVTGNCHLVALNKNGMYTKFFSSLGIKRIVGLTATPWKQDTKVFINKGWMETSATTKVLTRFPHKHKGDIMFGSIIYKLEMADLQKMGYIAPLKYFAEYPRRTVKLNATKSNYDPEDLSEYSDETLGRTEQVVEGIIKHMNYKRILVFTASVKSAYRLADALNKKGIKAAAVSGTTPKKERENLIQLFKDGEITVMVNCSCLTTGFDVPCLDHVVINHPTFSPSLLMQMCGRAARLDPENPNKVGTIWDLCGNTLKMGRAETIRLQKEDGYKDCLYSSVGRLDNVPLYNFSIQLKPKGGSTPVNSHRVHI